MNRKVILFIVIQLFLLLVLYVTLKFFSGFDLLKPPKDITIEIIGSHNNRLVLWSDGTDGRDLEVHAGKKVIWKIRGGEGAKDVQWFDIKPKGDQPLVFLPYPSRGNRENAAIGHLRYRATPENFEYSIVWGTGHGPNRTDDPKIAIRPGTNIFKLLANILVYVLLAGRISYMTFRTQRSSESRPS